MTNEKTNRNIFDRLGGDKVVWIIVLLLFMISLVGIFSSTSQLATAEQSRIVIVGRHLLTIFGGLALIILCYKINKISIFKRLSRWGFAFSMLLLVLVDAHTGIGPIRAASINGAWRILKLGSVQIHIFEVIKVAMVMYLAWAIDTYRTGSFKIQEHLSALEHFHWLDDDFWKKAINIYIPILLICAFSFPAGNSNTFFIAAVMFITILLAGMPFKDVFLIGVAALGILGGATGLYFLTKGSDHEIKILNRTVGTLVSRVTEKDNDVATFIAAKENTDEYYKALDKIRQPEGAKLAIKRGGIPGKGPGNSTMKYVIPVIYEDYIFSFLIEEYGLLLGGILVIFLYISLLARGSIIARNCDALFAKIAVAGLCMMITGQAMMHIMVNCNVGPLTGQTLPLISYGTSSFLCFSIAFGIILSISRMATEKVEKEAHDAKPLMEHTSDEVRDELDILNAYESGDDFNDIEI